MTGKLRRKSFTVLILASVFSLSSLQSVDASPCNDPNTNVMVTDGSCWNSKSEIAKANIVSGIWEGRKISNLDAIFSGNENSYFLNIEHSGHPAATTVGDIINYFDKLYSFPVNRKIRWKHAYLLSALNSRDDDTNDRINLLRFLRDNNDIPTSGEFIDVVNPNTIKIKYNSRLYNITLNGVYLDRADSKNNEKVLNILNLFKTYGYSNKCPRKNNSYVRIIYNTEFFNKDNNLIANIEILGNSYCIKNKIYNVSNIFDNDARKIVLNYFLLRKGLVQSQKISDLAWPRTKKFIYSFYKSANNNAQKRGLYKFGTNSDPKIERVMFLISGQGSH